MWGHSFGGGTARECPPLAPALVETRAGWYTVKKNYGKNSEMLGSTGCQTFNITGNNG